MNLNYKRGLIRFWIVASVVWLAAIATLYGDAEAVGFYLGHQYQLLARSPLSWKAALEQERITAIRSQSCRQAHELSCKHRDRAAYAQCIGSDRMARPDQRRSGRFDTLAERILGENEYDELIRERECGMPICDRDAYLRNAKGLFIAAGDSPDNLTAELCDGFRMIEVPRVNWVWISGAVLPIFLLLILWLIGTWIARGFVAAKGRPEK